jgi:glycosyltransferase involved in cell wall biosynthesis
MKFGIPESKLITIGNGIEPSELPASNNKEFRKKFGINEPFILHISHLSKPKGSYFLIESMKLLWQKGIELKLVIAGSESDDFTVFFSSLPKAIKKNIIHLSQISDSDKYNALSACEMFAMPSIVDAFGLVFLEAWFYKKPVIGVFAGGVPEVIDDGIYGYLVPFNDRYMMAEIIMKLHQNPLLASKMGEEGHKKIIQKYNWDKVYEETKTLYKELIEKNKS